MGFGTDAKPGYGTVRVNTLTVYKDGKPLDVKSNPGVKVTEDVMNVSTKWLNNGKEEDAPTSLKNRINDEKTDEPVALREGGTTLDLQGFEFGSEHDVQQANKIGLKAVDTVTFKVTVDGGLVAARGITSTKTARSVSITVGPVLRN